MKAPRHMSPNKGVHYNQSHGLLRSSLRIDGARVCQRIQRPPGGQPDKKHQKPCSSGQEAHGIYTNELPRIRETNKPENISQRHILPLVNSHPPQQPVHRYQETAAQVEKVTVQKSAFPLLQPFAHAFGCHNTPNGRRFPAVAILCIQEAYLHTI